MTLSRSFSVDLQWHQLVCRTFLDHNVFTLCRTSPVQTLHHIQNSVPEWLAHPYSWGLDFNARLSQGYILPKPGRHFLKARPIVNYSSAWPRRLGQGLGIALLEIPQVVYHELLKYKDVDDVMNEIKSLFSFATTQDIEYELYQSDIAGFYHQVEHSRIFHAVEFALHQFCLLQHVHLDSTRLYRLIPTKWNALFELFEDTGDHKANSTEKSNWLTNLHWFSIYCIVLIFMWGFKYSNNTGVLPWGPSGPQFYVQLLH